MVNILNLDKRINQKEFLINYIFKYSKDKNKNYSWPVFCSNQISSDFGKADFYHGLHVLRFYCSVQFLHLT